MDSNIRVEGSTVVIAVNPKVYPLETVYSASYVFLDRAFILLDGDPEKEVIVRLTPRSKEANIENFAGEFLNELINYADYAKRAEQTKAIREAILQRALLTNSPPEKPDVLDFSDIDAHLDDVESIVIPWEEKYKKKNDNKA
jgi:His-Xaa-Ser system protein HxsD